MTLAAVLLAALAYWALLARLQRGERGRVHRFRLSPATVVRITAGLARINEAMRRVGDSARAAQEKHGK